LHVESPLWRRNARGVSFLGIFTDRELRIIQQRASGLKSREIAKRDRVSLEAIYNVIKSVYRKAGIARKRGVNNTAENRPAPVVERKVPEGRIKMGRIRRAKR